MKKKLNKVTIMDVVVTVTNVSSTLMNAIYFMLMMVGSKKWWNESVSSKKLKCNFY